MDFLDPHAKKLRNIRLMVGYILITILIFTATTIIVFRAYGFDVDRKTGEIIQNGLVYIDSAPDNAEIFLNGTIQKSRTNARMTLPEGSYELLIRKDGYRDWKRSFNLRGGSIQRITYPVLMLQNLDETEVANYGKTRPLLSTQSPDRRWLFVSKVGSIGEFFEYDLNNPNPITLKPVERTVAFPETLFTPSDGEQSLEVVEWSTDNDHALIKHTFGTGYEFIVLSRERPETSTNISQLLGFAPSEVALRDKNFDQWYVYQKEGGILRIADSKKTLTPVLENVTSYKTHDASIILYAQTVSENVQNIYLRQNNQSYLLRTVTAGAVHLNIARYDGDWYAAVGSDGDKKTYLYKNPMSLLVKIDNQKPAPVSVFHAEAPLSNVSFSNSTRFIMAQAGQQVGVYDAEKSETYSYNFSSQFDGDTKVSWMDGHRMIARSGGYVVVFDFDGSNSQELVRALSGVVTFFDRDYTVLYTINSSKRVPDTTALFVSDLRFQQDK